jgi:hypothetical protein
LGDRAEYIQSNQLREQLSNASSICYKYLSAFKDSSFPTT